MSEETKWKLESLEKLIEDIPVPKKVLKVIRGVIELRVILEISEAFKAREKKLLMEMLEETKPMEREGHDDAEQND